jgi:hypothetical protein
LGANRNSYAPNRNLVRQILICLFIFYSFRIRKASLSSFFLKSVALQIIFYDKIAL